MPSGSKKRKSSKKPKPGEPPTPQGEPPELESGLVESMAKEGEEVFMEGSPMEEANVEEGVEEGRELSRGASQGGTELEEASTPPLDEVSLSDPSSQPELEPELHRAEVPNGIKVEGEAAVDIAQRELPPQIKEEIDTPSPQIEPESDALLAEFQPDVQACAAGTELEPDPNDTDAPPNDIVTEADEAKPKEGTPTEIGSEPREAQSESEPGTDEVSVEVEQTADIAEEEKEQENGMTPDAIPLEVETGVHEAPVEMNAVVDDAPGDAQPENDEATIARDLDTDAASATIEPEGTDDATVETEADSNEGPTSVQAEMDEAVVERQVETDAVGNVEVDSGLEATPVDAQPEIDETPVVGDLDPDLPSTDIEPAASADVDPAATDGTSVEIAAGSGNVESEVEEPVIPRQLETDAVEPQKSAARVENESEKETAEAEGDAFLNENLQEGELTYPNSIASKYKTELEPETGISSAAVEPEMETTNREAESETESYPSEIKRDEDTTLDDAGKDEVAQPEGKSEDEVAQANVEPDPNERDSGDVEPEVQSDNICASLEDEADALKGIEIESEGPGDDSMEIEAEAGPTTQEAGELVEKTELTDEAVAETSKGAKEDGSEAVETPLEAHTEPEGGTMPLNELATEAMVPTEVENVSECQPDRKSSTETESDEQALVENKPDQQVQEQERATESGVALDSAVEASELPATENDQVDVAAVSVGDDTDLADAAVSSLPVGEAAANVGTVMPAFEQENTGRLEEREAISPSGEVLQVEAGEAAHKDGVVESERDAVDGEQNESKDEIGEQETAVVDDRFDEDKSSFGELNTTVSPHEQDLGIELPLATTFDGEVPLKEEHLEEVPVRKLSQPAPDLTMDPSFVDVSSGESEMVKQGLHTTFPPLSELPVSECESKDGVAFEQEVNFDSPSGDVERDVGEEEAASSTVAEAGSVFNDFDESASDQQLPSDFPSEQDADISESSEFDDTSLSKAPELMETGSTEPLDGECKEILTSTSQVDKDDQVEPERSAAAYSHGDGNTISPVAVGDDLKDEVEWKNVQDLEASSKREEVSPESAKADDPVTSLSASVTSPVDGHLVGEGDVPDKELNIENKGEDGDKNREGAVPSTFGIVPALEYRAVAEKELMSKVSPSETDGQSSLSGLEASTHDLVIPVDTTGIQDNAAVTTTEPEIGTAEANDFNAATYIPSEKELKNNYYDETQLQSASPGRDIQDVEAFRQQNTQEASLPVVVPAQDVKQRALEKVNLTGNERQSGGMTLQHRTEGLGCCGLFDLLLGKKQ